MVNTFATRTTLSSGSHDYEMYSLPKLAEKYPQVASLPYSLKILLENVLRLEDGLSVTRSDIEALANWDPAAVPNIEISYTPARVLLQDFTGVPALVDLAAMRDAMKTMGGDAAKINPLQPADLVIDHSVMVDEFRSHLALERNIEREYERNGERYAFLRWGQTAFDNFTVVPPGTGIVHQINLEYLARGVFANEGSGEGGAWQAYPDTLVGTDSHTTMVNGLGVLGWGVGGIEAEAAMLGQPVSMLIPQVIGFELNGDLTEGTTATDLVLTVTEMLREKGVVGKFVEFYGAGLSNLPLADRATIGNMSPEFGSTCAIFPIDAETLRYMEFTGRSADQVALVEAYMREQQMWHDANSVAPRFTDKLSLDLGDVVPSIAGPKRPQDRIALTTVKKTFNNALADMRPGYEANNNVSTLVRWTGEGGTPKDQVHLDDHGHAATATAVKPHTLPDLTDGTVVIAAITSCTNTSNPSVMVAAGLVAKKARERGLVSKPWVKTSLAPGSKVVTRYYEAAGLDKYLDEMGFATVGYGCTTCIGNSGPLPEEVLEQIDERDLVVASVLSGNRNFEGRINGDVKMNFLASPPLVVAYAIAGHMDWDPYTEPIGTDTNGDDVFLKDIWPSQAEIAAVMTESVRGEMFRSTYEEVYEGDERWRGMQTPLGDLFEWAGDSTYIRKAPYFDGMPATPTSVTDIAGARCLVKVGDSITTDHISPAGGFKADTPAGKYLLERGVEQRDFNSYGSRRGNHEVMVRGTFANVRLRNELAPGTEGGFTKYFGDGDGSGDVTTIFEASEKYIAHGTPLVVLSGKEYGSGSSRDWAAKGPRLLGVRAVIAESYERIHRSNLVGMGILPLQYRAGDTADSLGLTGDETFDIVGIATLLTDEAANSGLPDDRNVTVTATSPDGSVTTFKALVRVDTPQEVHYYQHGGILQYVLRGLVAN